MADVFLSYKREDAAKVGKLVAALRRLGLDCWWDEDIPPSAPWEATIEQELARAKSVIVCWSPHAVASENVRSEARVAREDGRLIQLFLKPCNPPLFFGERQGLDLSRWRGASDDPRISRIAEAARRIAAGERVEVGEHRKALKRFDLRVASALAALLLLVIGGVGWWMLSATESDRPQTLAVLPFRAINSGDANLVDAIWDDTRGAISRNPNLRVLGRQAMQSLARKQLEPADYRRKVGADYLLDGNVQRAGNKVLMNVSLTRTKDGAEVWSDSVSGRLDDVFKFQQNIAREVEGRIRGRVAPGGGVTAKNIATTGEVYSIFAEARAKTRLRNSTDAHAAIALLKKALVIDPNYAPAWAELGAISGMGISRTPGKGPAQQMKDAVSYLNRAIQLAPNLAHAHAALAMVQNFPPELEGELKKAVQLDPNDAEAWSWLGNLYQGQNRLDEARAAYSRAADIEPLWPVAVANKIGNLMLKKDRAGVERELHRVEKLDDPVLLIKTKMLVAANDFHPGDQVALALQLRASHPEEASWADDRLALPLLELGFIDEAIAAWHLPPDVARAYRGIAESPETIRSWSHNPRDLWEDDDAGALFGRLLPRNGRLKEYIGYFDAAFQSPADFIAFTEYRPGHFILTAPTLACDLRAAGRSADAEVIIRHADELLQAQMRKGEGDAANLGVLSRVRAAEGRDQEALALLRTSVAEGDLPDRGYEPTDIAEEPCFARLVNRTDFQAIRRRVFQRIEDERRKVPLGLLAQAYPRKRQLAA